MSRIGKQPIKLPSGVYISVADGLVSIKGPLGDLSMPAPVLVQICIEVDVVTFIPVDQSTEAKALSGTVRALVANMVTGVTKGFQKRLILVGVGYKAQVQGDVLNLALGFSHPINHKLPSQIKAETPTPTEILIKGIDRQQVGQVAAVVRSYRPPEPYKGKGIRGDNEVVLIKDTKKK